MNAAAANPIIEAALAYAARGWPVFPCSPVDKKPLIENGFKAASVDPAQIRAWWRADPRALIAVPTGRTIGAVVLDLDPRDTSADAILRDLGDFCGGVLPPCPRTRTQSGGLHLWFSYPPGSYVGNRANLFKRVEGGPSHVDVRGEGGYVVVPPSVMRNGRSYAWEKPAIEPLPDPPGRLLDLILRQGEFAPQRTEMPPARPLEPESEPPGRRYALAALEAEARAAAQAPPGERNHQLNQSAFSLGTLVGAGALHENEVKAALEDAALAVDLVRDDGWKSVRDTISSGLKAGAANPRDIPDPLSRPAARNRTEARREIGAQKRLPSRGPERRIIQVVASELPRVVDEAEQVIMEAGVPIFSRAGTLVEPIQEQVLAERDRLTTIARLKPLPAVALVDQLAQAATFQRYDLRKEEWVNIDPPTKVADTLLAREGHWRLPSIAGVITTPTLRPDGTILSTPGYDPATRLYLSPDEALRMPPVPISPSRGEAEAALRLLSNLLVGFPFVGPVDRAVALSALLTAILRPGLPTAPAHVIRAHTPGTGKSYFVDLCATIVSGRPCPVMAVGKTEEETEKRLGAMLLAGTPIISLDNVNGELGGDALCQMSERPLVRIRILGQSEAPEIECRSTIFATGNNITLVGDMTRRCVLCTLDAGVERPELREFTFDPIARVLADRGAYIAAVITIVRAYRAAGRRVECSQIGSYGAWSETVRAPLIWLGEADPVLSMEIVRDEDPELGTIREFFSRWLEHLFESAPYTSSAIIGSASERDGNGELIRPEFHELLLRIAGRGPQIEPRRLGKWLSVKVKGRVVDRRKLEVQSDASHGNRFILRQIA